MLVRAQVHAQYVLPEPSTLFLRGSGRAQTVWQEHTRTAQACPCVLPVCRLCRRLPVPARAVCAIQAITETLAGHAWPVQTARTPQAIVSQTA